MITIIVKITETENEVHIGIKGNGEDNTDLEADIADVFRVKLKETRDEVYKQFGIGQIVCSPEKYIRVFDSPEERDKRL